MSPKARWMIVAGIIVRMAVAAGGLLLLIHGVDQFLRHPYASAPGGTVARLNSWRLCQLSDPKWEAVICNVTVANYGGPGVSRAASDNLWFLPKGSLGDKRFLGLTPAAAAALSRRLAPDTAPIPQLLNAKVGPNASATGYACFLVPKGSTPPRSVQFASYP